MMTMSTERARARGKYYRLVRPDDGGDADDVDGCGFEWKRGGRGEEGEEDAKGRRCLVEVADLDSARRMTTTTTTTRAGWEKQSVARALDFTSIVEYGARLVDDEDSVVTDASASSSAASSVETFVDAADDVSQAPRTLREAFEAVDIAAKSARERKFDVDSVKALVTEFSAVRRAVGIDAGWRYEEDEEDARVARELRVKADRANLEARIAEAEAEMLRREADEAHESFKATYGEDAWVDPLSREVDAWYTEASNRLAEIEPRRSAFAGMRYADLASSLTASEPVSWLHLEESPTKRPLTSYSV